MVKKLTTYSNRAELISRVKQLSPWAEGEASSILGGYAEAKARLAALDPIQYGRTRNYGNGKISYLSPYIHHGVVSLNEVRHAALRQVDVPERAYKFIQELAWREFWQLVYQKHPEWLWRDAEPYKTGFAARDYADELPDDIRYGRTETACINQFIQGLIKTGYMHNHARMYVASYVVHFRRVKWQAGARWFLHHLLDGDLASNNFSWQWVASTFSEKPYIFNLENVTTYFASDVDTTPANNQLIAKTYAELNKKLFPNLGNHHD